MSWRGLLPRLLPALLVAAASGPAMAQMPAQPSAPSRLGQGYFHAASMPDSTTLLPPPPAAGSAGQREDDGAARAALRLRGSARWDQAIMDADLFTPAATSSFSCAAGIAIGPEKTPALNRLMRRLGADFAMSAYGAKRKYQRQRPFLVNGAPVCTPEMAELLAKDGSYPSGHAAIGEGWGLLLAALIPAQARALRQRGASFADSRRICNVHWRSDVAAGQTLARAVWAKVQLVPAFRDDFAAAKVEIESARAVPEALAPEELACAQERRALRAR